MNRLVRAELLRLRTTRSFYGWAAAAAAGVVLAVAFAIQTSGTDGNAITGSSEDVRRVFVAASSNSIIVLLLAILGMAGEFRYGTAAATFLITPDRGRVVRAKLAAYALVGLVIAALSSVLTVAVALPWLAIKGVHVSLLSGDVAAVLAGALLANALYGVIGVGIAAVVRREAAAVAGSLAWMMLVEGLVVGLAPAVGRWFPGGAANALTGITTGTGRLLPVWAGGLVLAAYAAAAAVAGGYSIGRRDIA